MTVPFPLEKKGVSFSTLWKPVEKMEVICLRFPHIADKIFELLNNKSLTKCREVHKTWLWFIDSADFPWCRILKNYPMENGQTLLHIAAKTGQLDKCELILDSDSEVPKDNNGYTPFHEAAKKGHLNLCKFFNENAKGKSPISDIGWSPLHAAAFMGKHLVCEWLMKNTEDKNLTDWLGCTPLHLAGCNNNFKACKAIIDNEGDNAVEICPFCIWIIKEESQEEYICHYIRKHKKNLNDLVTVWPQPI